MTDSSSSEHRSAKDIFFATLDKPTPEERAEFLDGACGANLALRRQIEALLFHHFQADPFMNKPAVEAALGIGRDGPPSEVPGATIGRYKLLQKLGEGGCGVVYMAEQEEPIRRGVALKVIKLGMDTKAVIARFEAERQALALMDHPHIARVLDAGSTESGRPFFVMELVRGVKITDYCDQRHLDTLARLELFIQICQAIQHAHQKGIIHRDLKPSNILVADHDGVPVPKVIDFGIAKATTDQRLTDKTVFTAYEQFVGTPAYMSPEQAELSPAGTGDIDTRSDIYSLGVLLYELLTGATPFDPRELLRSGMEAMRKTIREREPQRPSTKVAMLRGEDRSTTATRHATEPPALIRRLQGDLDWIVMKCLEKDRARRYETANGLAMDLKRHLDNEPVQARPPSGVYRLRKSIRRNKLAYTATALVSVTLILGIIASAWQAMRATKAKRDALAAQAQAIEAREQAQTQELAARRRAYASDMMVAHEYLGREKLRDALGLLDRQRPEPGQTDLRDWEWRYLWQQARSDAVSTLGKNLGKTSSLAISSDTNWLAVGMVHRGGLAVWNLRTRRESISLATNEERIRAAFSPTEPILAFTSVHRLDSGEQRSTLRFWNAATQGMLCEPIPLTSECAGVCFSKDGRLAVTSTKVSPATRGKLTLWRVTDGAQLTNYASDQSAFEDLACFAATPDLSLAAYTYYPPTEGGQWIRVVNLHTGDEVWHAPAARLRLTSLAFSPNGEILAAGMGIGESQPLIKLWDVASGMEMKPLKGHRSHVHSMVFWPDGTRLASGSTDQTIRIWDLKSRECLDVLRGQADLVLTLALSPDGQTLVSGGGREGTVCFWDTSVTHPRQPNSTLPQKVLAWRFSADSRSILALHPDGQVARWSGADFRQKTTILEIGTNLPHAHYLYRFSQDGRFLAAGSFNGVLQIWDVSQRRLRRQWTNTAGLVVPSPQGFQSEGDELFTWSGTDNRLHKWDVRTGEESMPPVTLPQWLRRGTLSPNGQLVVVADERGTIWRLNLSHDSRQALSPSLVEASDITFSPGGNLVAISSYNGNTWVWDTATWQLQASNLYGLFKPAFSPDGKRLATGGGTSRAVSLWDTASWKNVLNLKGQSDGFEDTAFSPDGNVIGSPNYVGTLHLWRAPSWNKIQATEKAQAENPREQ